MTLLYSIHLDVYQVCWHHFRVLTDNGDLLFLVVSQYVSVVCDNDRNRKGGHTNTKFKVPLSITAALDIKIIKTMTLKETSHR